MMRTSLFLSMVLTVAGATALGAHASAGGIGKEISPLFLTQTMGLRLMTAPTGIQQGQQSPKKFDCQVVDADRFAGRGFPGAKVNDEVTIVALGPKRGTVKHSKSGKAHVFKVTDDGKVEKE